MEQEEIIRDSNGNEKRTVTHTIGNQSHIVITESGPDGTKQTDQLINIDEGKSYGSLTSVHSVLLYSYQNTNKQIRN